MRKWFREQVVQPLKALFPFALLTIMFLSALLVPVAVEVPIVAADENWLTGYSYRQEFVVNGTEAGAQTDIQLKLLIDNATDTSAGTHCYVNGRVQADFDDIRFTTDDMVTELDFWVEDVNSGVNATVWVEFDSVSSGAATTTTFYMYYGNNTVSAGSNGNTTFLFFDHFVGTDLNTSKWFESSADGSYSVSSSILQVTGANGVTEAILAKDSYRYGYPVSFEFRAKVDESQAFHIGAIDTWENSTSPGAGTDEARFAYRATGKIYRTQDQGSSTNAARSSTLTSYTNLRIDYANATAVQFYEDDVLKLHQTDNNPSDDLGYSFTAKETNVDVWIDWCFIRKISTPQPYFGTWGTEETQSNLPLVSTDSATSINYLNATLQGNITSVGSENCSLRGFEWTDRKENFTESDNSWSSTYLGGALELAQTFTTNETINATSVRLKLFQERWLGQGPLDCNVELRTCSDGYPTNTTLRSGSINASEIIESNEGAWYSIEFASPYLLSNNTQYAIVIGTPNATVGTGVGWRCNDNASYTGGAFLAAGGFGGAGEENSDAMFEVWGREAWTEGTGAWDGTAGVFNYTVTVSNTTTVHEFRAKAYNPNGWGYGSWTNYSYSGGPAVDTTDVTPGETDARLSGAITSVGEGLCDYRGFVWDTQARGMPDEDEAPNATAYTYNWSEGSGGSYVYGVGSFNTNITSLNRSAHYYYRAFAHNNNTWAYGDEVEFWTLAAGPTNLTDSNRTSSSVTLVWDRGEGAVNTKILYKSNTYPANATDGMVGYLGTSNTTVVPNLSPGQLYYFRAWSWASGGYSLNYTNDTAVTLIQVVTQSATGVTNSSATLRGDLTSSWDNIKERGFQWGTATGNYTSQWTQLGNYTTGSYSHTNSTFSNTTTYYYRAMANGTAGWSYGAEEYFTTTAAAAPTVETNDATNIGDTSAIIHGTLTSLGDYSPVYVSFEYGQTTSYGYNTTEQTKTSAGVFNVTLSGLQSNDIYYYRAKVRYGTSYSYGAREAFTTTGTLEAPSNFATTRGDTTVTLTWVKGLGADRTLIKRSTVNYPTTVDSGVQIYLGSGTTVTDTGLSNSQDYYYSAWSESSGVYSSNYAIAYSAADIGEDILNPPDTFYITNVMVFDSYQEDHDQLICFEYQIKYDSGDPAQDVSEFFAFELYSGTTMIARAPVMAWGWKPGSIYLSEENAMEWGGAGYTVKIRGVSGQWSVIPEASAAITSNMWQVSQGDLDELKEWVLSIAKIIDSSWIASTDGEALNDVGCAVFRAAISGLTTVIEGVCSSSEGYIVPDYEQEGTDYQRELTRERNLGNYTNNIIDTMGDTFGIDGDSMGTMIMVIMAIALAIFVGIITRNSGFATGSTVPVLVLGNYLGLIPLAATMVAGGLTVMFILWHIWIRGT